MERSIEADGCRYRGSYWNGVKHGRGFYQTPEAGAESSGVSGLLAACEQSSGIVFWATQLIALHGSHPFDPGIGEE